jgi:hypothetical protein
MDLTILCLVIAAVSGTSYLKGNNATRPGERAREHGQKQVVLGLVTVLALAGATVALLMVLSPSS